MTNEIMEAISTNLNAEFGYEVHIEKMKQGCLTPCFFISSLHHTTKLFFGKRYFRANTFCIQYVPQSENKQQECNEVAEKMVWCLQYVTLDSGLTHGTAMKYEVVDGVLHFFVNYDCFVCQLEEETAMEVMQTDGRLKGGD